MSTVRTTSQASANPPAAVRQPPRASRLPRRRRRPAPPSPRASTSRAGGRRSRRSVDDRCQQPGDGEVEARAGALRTAAGQRRRWPRTAHGSTHARSASDGSVRFHAAPLTRPMRTERSRWLNAACHRRYREHATQQVAMQRDERHENGQEVRHRAARRCRRCAPGTPGARIGRLRRTGRRSMPSSGLGGVL